MLKRLSAITPGFRGVGWLVLTWTFLAHASTGVFAFTVFATASDWLSRNAWAGFVAGFLSLTMAVMWPDIKQRIPSWIKLPLTQEERLTATESALVPLNGLATKVDGASSEFYAALELQNKAGEMAAQIRDIFDKRISSLEDDRIKAIGEKSKIDIRLLGVEAESRKTTGKVDDLTKVLGNAREAAIRHRNAMMELVGSYTFIIDLTVLAENAGLLVKRLYRIINMNPASEDAKFPLSKPWYVGHDSYPEALVFWSMDINSYVSRCKAFANSNNMPVSTYLDEGFSSRIEGWQSSETVDQCASWIEAQRELLLRARDFRVKQIAGTLEDEHMDRG